jgi:PAS domain S-box-containing protein
VNKKIFIILTLIFTGTCALLFNIFYQEAKNTAIKELNDEQMIHAKQAARGIEDFFATWTRSLNALTQMDEIIDLNTVGKHSMRLFYKAHQEQIRAITRLDERGVILFNLPASSSAGVDISDQKHVRELLRDHQPVVSDVFTTVEGFSAIALHMPVFRGSIFKGSVGILINFESLAKRYLDVIKVGETGFAWVVSRDGTQLYSAIPGFTGKSVFENIQGFPGLISMVHDMLQGHEGTGIYTFNRIDARNVGQVTKYAVYMPVHVGKTFWSIAVASAEEDVLSGLISFKNKLAVFFGALFIFGMVFSTLGVKAWFLIREEEKRRRILAQLEEETSDRLRAEEALRGSEEMLKFSLKAADLGAWDLDLQNHTASRSLLHDQIFGYPDLLPEWTYEMFLDHVLPEDRPEVDRIFQEAVKGHHDLSIECRIRRMDGAVRWIWVKGRSQSNDLGLPVRMLGLVGDITERKQGELEIKRLKEQLQADYSYLQEEIKLTHDFEHIIGNSNELKYVLHKVEQVAPSDTTVLILGETGTGKELIARAIHSSSPRQHRPLIKVDCASLSPTLIESELFGHEKGAFTGAQARKIGRFELAHGSTLFLDEIGELPLELQTKLLRVVQEGEFERLGSSQTLKADVRIIAATNRDLEEEVRQGRFREDLWYRLNVFPITVPPLRQRQEDIPLLVQSFANRLSRKMGKEITRIPQQVVEVFQQYSWPGNIRELENVIERAIINTGGSVLQLAEKINASPPMPTSPTKSLEAVERAHILRVLEEVKWKIDGKDGAAAKLELNPSTLRSRMRKLAIVRNQ